MVNPQEIKQVVLNLLVNALDSIEENGKVRVAARRSGGEGVLIFTDDGCGMTSEVLDHLFEPFFSSQSRSSGLGLYICRELCQRHGGSISYARAERPTARGPQPGNAFTVHFRGQQRQPDTASLFDPIVV
jgi:two-component system sensor histidine kinase PilS (NtrC family)